jgi:hypothetical protein
MEATGGVNDLPECLGPCYPLPDSHDWECAAAGGSLLVWNHDLDRVLGWDPKPESKSPFRMLAHWPQLSECPDCLVCMTAHPPVEPKP